MNCVLYARVSTEEQADLSIPAQLQAMRDFAKRKDWRVVEEFLEPGVSGRSIQQRQALQALLERCKQEPKVEVVLVHKIDRLARNVLDHATIRFALQQRGIRLASVVENVDDSISGQLLENIMASIAQFYSGNLGEETKKGMRMLVERGGWPFQPMRTKFRQFDLPMSSTRRTASRSARFVNCSLRKDFGLATESRFPSPVSRECSRTPSMLAEFVGRASSTRAITRRW
jgi:DNA invertase Pin-like site-specific DNA recombinase